MSIPMSQLDRANEQLENRNRDLVAALQALNDIQKNSAQRESMLQERLAQAETKLCVFFFFFVF